MKKPTQLYGHYPEVGRYRIFRILYEADEPLSMRQLLIRCGVKIYTGPSMTPLRNSLASRLYTWVVEGYMVKTGMYQESRYTLTPLGKMKYILLAGAG